MAHYLGHVLRILALISSSSIILFSWHQTLGFDPRLKGHWQWLFDVFTKQSNSLPVELIYPIYYAGGVLFVLLCAGAWADRRSSSNVIGGGRSSADIHGSARWATKKDVKQSGLLDDKGVVVGGWNPSKHGETQILRHNGPEHVLCFAPTRSGKGVSLVLPTLLSWQESALILDIKGENFAKSAGWRAAQGQRVVRFDPSDLNGSAKYNPLQEVRIGTDYEIADCQNIAIMIIDPDGTGLKDFWQQEGYAWLTTAILHVLYRIKINEQGRVATLSDVRKFMSIGDDSEEALTEVLRKGFNAKEDDSFERLLIDMETFDHGRDVVNDEVRQGAARMRKRAGNERSGVHSTGTSQLTLYADPIVSRNISSSDFRIADLMNAEQPMSLYIVIPPSEIARLRPLVRILLNQFLTRLTGQMTFKNGQEIKQYKHRLLLMLDEFTSVGKLEIFEKAIAFMGGYGLKSFIIVQDLTQLQKAYGREQSIVSNCHVRIAFAPNTLETARLLSDMTGKTTIVQKRTSASWTHGKSGSSHTESISEVSRPLMTPDECMSLPGLTKKADGSIARAGDMLTFLAGHPPIYGRQYLYFQNEDYLARAALQLPEADKSHDQPESAEDAA